jgi:hypothetical protein
VKDKQINSRAWGLKFYDQQTMRLAVVDVEEIIESDSVSGDAYLPEMQKLSMLTKTAD